MKSATDKIPDEAKGREDLSVVVPLFAEAENLDELYRELQKVLPGLGMSWEIIFVDDGSQDQSWERIMALHDQDGRVKGIRFSRNYGHQYALFAGLAQARGEVVITMDADLQHPPDVIPELLAEWRRGNKIVNTIRVAEDRQPLFKRLTSKYYYKIFSFLSGVPIESGMADFRLLDRQVVDSILEFKEEGLFLRGIIQTVGFPSATITYQCQDRYKGESKYTLLKMVRLAWTGITSFSLVPLRLSIVIGILMSLFAFYQLVDAVYVKLFTDRSVPGWASAIGLASLMFGMLFIFLGIIGEYIGRILIETRQRPRYLVRERVGFSVKAKEE